MTIILFGDLSAILKLDYKNRANAYMPIIKLYANRRIKESN